MTLVLAGSAVIVVLMWAFLTFKPVPGAPTGFLANLIASLLVVVFGFLFVTVSSRIAGLIGTSSNPISGMAIATLMATCALFLLAGWTVAAYGALALTIGGTVCIAAANAGNTSQDLKTGFLVGAPPSAQQKGLFLGVLGLAPALARWRLPTAALTAVSIVAGMTVGLTWAASASSHYRETVWGELVRVVSQRTDSRLYGDLAKNLLTWAGPTAGVAAVAVGACAAAAYVVALARPQRS